MKYKGKEYQVRDSNCKKCKSFLPFSGNGRNICRLYELGKCPKIDGATGGGRDVPLKENKNNG